MTTVENPTSPGEISSDSVVKPAATQISENATAKSGTVSTANAERKPILINRQWFGPTEGRTCGTCAVCCTWLGIEELKKWTGQACKHLDGRIPDKRCSIYEHRPSACSKYSCFWLTGWGPEELQPNRSGLLLTPYQREGMTGDTPEATAVTVIITDEEKAKPIMDTTVAELMLLGISEIRLVNYKRKTGLLYIDGKIYNCRILKQSGYEELTFSTDNKAIATYAIADKEPESDKTVR